MRTDLHNNVKALTALNQQTINSATTTNGVIIDTKGFEAIEFLIFTGVITTGDFAPLIEEGDDSGLSDAAAVTGDDLLGTIAGATVASGAPDNSVLKIGVKKGTKRYIRLSIVSSNTPNGILGAVAILGTPERAPVA